MDEFSYLSVLLSVVLGLAVTQILQGFRARMLSHAHIRQYWPTKVWAAVLLLICTQTWWAMFGLRERHDWSFEQFTILLAQTVALYLLAGLVFPDMPREQAVDLREHYFAQRKRFFAIAVVAALISIERDVLLSHALPNRVNLAFHLFFIGAAVSGIVVAREWYHKALSLLMAAVFLLYVSLMFTKLQ